MPDDDDGEQPPPSALSARAKGEVVSADDREEDEYEAEAVPEWLGPALERLIALGETAVKETSLKEREVAATQERMQAHYADKILPHEVQLIRAERRMALVRLILGLVAAAGLPIVFDQIGHADWVPWWIAVILALFSGGGEKLTKFFTGLGPKPKVPPPSP